MSVEANTTMSYLTLDKISWRTQIPGWIINHTERKHMFSLDATNILNMPFVHSNTFQP